MIVSMSTSGTEIDTQLKFIRDNMISSETPLTILTPNFITSIQTYGAFVDRTIYDWVGSLNYTPLITGLAVDFLCPETSRLQHITNATNSVSDNSSDNNDIWIAANTLRNALTTYSYTTTADSTEFITQYDAVTDTVSGVRSYKGTALTNLKNAITALSTEINPSYIAPIHSDVVFKTTSTTPVRIDTDSIPFGNGSTVSPLKDLLNCLHITLEVLHEPNLIKYKMNRTELEVINYDGTALTGYANIKDSVEKILPNIAKLNKATSNIEVIKRVLKGFIMLIESYLNLTKNHLSDCIQKENVAFLTQNGSINPTFDSLQFIEEHRKSRHLHKKVSNYETKYDKGIKTIDEQEKYIDDINSKLKYQSGNVKNNSRNLIKNSVFHYIYLSLFVVFVITLMLIATTKDDSSNKDKSKIVVGTIFGISVVSFIIFYSINNSIFESFSVTRAVATDTIEQEFVKYLENTINLGILVDTNMRYSDIVYKLEKEVNENDNKGTQLKLEKESLKDKQTHDYRTSKILRARIMLLLQILILLSATVFVNLMVSGIDVYLTVVFTIVFIFIVYLYIIKASRYVNTDARKIYWQKPSDKMLR